MLSKYYSYFLFVEINQELPGQIVNLGCIYIFRSQNSARYTIGTQVSLMRIGNDSLLIAKYPERVAIPGIQLGLLFLLNE
jgi:hypothetical protein